MPLEQPGQTPQGTPAEGTPTVELEIDGKRETFSHQQLSEGLMRQQDYTKKTQELSTQKQEMDRLRDQYEGFGQFQTLLNNDPGLAQEVADVIEKRRTGSGPQGEYNKEPQEPSEFNEAPQVPQEVKDRLAYVEDGLARQELGNKIEALRKRFPNANIDSTIDYAVKHNLGVNLEGAYKEMSFDESVREAKEKGEKAGAQKIIQAMSDRNLTDIQTGKGSSPNLQGVQLTKEQRQYATMMGLSDKDYIEGMKKRGTESPEQRAEV